MYYNFDLGKIRAKSFTSNGSVNHELRHYGSLVSSFKTKEAKMDVDAILREHYTMLLMKNYLANPNKRFAISQLAIDISDLYLSMTSESIERVLIEKSYAVSIRGFAEQWNLLPKMSEFPFSVVNAGLKMEFGKLAIVVGFETKEGKLIWKVEIPPGTNVQLKAAALANYFRDSLAFKCLLQLYS